MYNKISKMPSNMTHQFSKIPDVQIQRSSFTRDAPIKTTFDSDLLVPIDLEEILPGDSMNVKLNAKIRLATPIHPIMDNLKVSWFWFFVPMRLVWDSTEKFFGQQLDPDSSIAFTIPETTSSIAGMEDRLPDYFGLPVGNVTGTITFNILPYRCYHLIRDEWFRDENLQDSADVITDDTGGIINNGNRFDLHKRAKRADYFTTGLPWTAKFASVTLPLGTSAPVVAEGTGEPTFTDGTTTGKVRHVGSTTNFNWANTASGAGDFSWGDPALEADLSAAIAPTLNEFRQSVAIQHLNERFARCGTRYTEIIKGVFNVDSADARLQRPELLGMGTSYMNILSVPQTGQTATTPQGNLAAFGEIEIRDHVYTKSFTEHGYVIGMINVQADLTYSQCLHRMWSRSTKDDFYWPDYSGIGEQAILSKEIYADGTAGDEDVFAYQERFSEYRYKTGLVTGLFRPKRASNLSPWILTEEFGSRPTLGDTFIQSSTQAPLDNAIAVPAEPQFLMDGFIQNKSARPMPIYSTPGLQRL